MIVISAPRSSRKRRQYSAEFKAKIIAACQQPGVSVSAIALDNGLNANLVRRWISDAKKLGSTTSA
ncbi:transposase, partial [Hahella ganghwensis]